MIVYSVVRHYYEEDDLIGIAASIPTAKVLAEEDVLHSESEWYDAEWREYPDLDETSRTSRWGTYAILPWTVAVE